MARALQVWLLCLIGRMTGAQITAGPAIPFLTTPTASTPTGIVNAGTILSKSDVIKSATGRFYFTNFTVYRADSGVQGAPLERVWQPGIDLTSAAFMEVQAAGNLLITNTNGSPLWSTNSANPDCTTGTYLELESNEGTLILHSCNEIRWESICKNDRITIIRNGQLPSPFSMYIGSYLSSPNGSYVADFKCSGELAIIKMATQTEIWKLGIGGKGGWIMTVTMLGNLNIYNQELGDASYKLIWQTNTSDPNCPTFSYLQMQDDGNLVLNSCNRTSWSAFPINKPPTPTAVPPNASHCDSASTAGVSFIKAGEATSKGVIWSKNQQYYFSCYIVSRLLLPSKAVVAVWWPLYDLRRAANMTLRRDGNLVIYNDRGEIWWETFTANIPFAEASQLVLADDGNLQLISGGLVRWQSICKTDRLTDIKSTLPSGLPIYTGMYLTSANRIYTASLDCSGNLMIMTGSKIIWSTKTGGRKGWMLFLQDNGNLMLYSLTVDNSTTETLGVVWSTNTSADASCPMFRSYLLMQDDGRLALYGCNGVYWASPFPPSSSGPEIGSPVEVQQSRCQKWTAIGCVPLSEVNVFAPTWKSSFVTGETIDPGGCTTFCNISGYAVAGLATPFMCYCSDCYEPPALDPECPLHSLRLFKCVANSGSAENTCMAPVPRLSPSQYEMKGCYSNPPEQLLRGLPTDYMSNFIASANMSTALCIEYCASRNYRIAGLSIGMRCHCGNCYSTEPIVNECCSASCMGSPSEECGGVLSMTVHGTKDVEVCR